jgi:hypothetical protein
MVAAKGNTGAASVASTPTSGLEGGDHAFLLDPTVLPGGQWFLLDTYPIDGYQHVVLFHRPSLLFVPLAKLKNTAQDMTDYRVDIHARSSRDGRTVCIDATHEGLGRQMYIIPIGHILDHPPRDR